MQNEQQFVYVSLCITFFTAVFFLLFTSHFCHFIHHCFIFTYIGITFSLVHNEHPPVSCSSHIVCWANVNACLFIFFSVILNTSSLLSLALELPTPSFWKCTTSRMSFHCDMFISYIAYLWPTKSMWWYGTSFKLKGKWDSILWWNILMSMFIVYSFEKCTSLTFNDFILNVRHKFSPHSQRWNKYSI